MATIWKNSDLVDFGSFESVRRAKKNTGSQLFPILKLTHPDQESLRLIHHEFNMLISLASLGLPIPKVDLHPIRDGTITCGYRMNELFKMDTSELRSRKDDIEVALRRLHSAGFCHGDTSCSNFLQDDKQNIVLIDYSFAGAIGVRFLQASQRGYTEMESSVKAETGRSLKKCTL
ncbi:hypothetical protein F5Y16DRAFT_360470 [Xylariaceae sp. FL0255]|nr:hypothetical protein F5Y16DRAFT_360470 [Xylariaceae sp. FL0255]